MNTNSLDTAERLKRARILLLLDHAFFGMLATRLPNAVTPDVETAITDGETAWWNPEFVATLSDDELRGTMAALVSHVANGHTWRRDGRETGQWNESCDRAIHGVLRDAGLVLPATAPMPSGSEIGKSAESIYAMQPARPPKPSNSNSPASGGKNGPGTGSGGKNAPQSPGRGKPGKQPGGGSPKPSNAPPNGAGAPGSGTDPGKCGGVIDAPADKQKQQAAEWKIAVSQAAECAKRAGQLPGELARMVKEIVDPKLSVEQLLRDFIVRTARNDYAWNVPNRRYLQSGIVLPSLISDELPEIVLAIDTSGSIGQRELDTAAAILSAIIGAYETTVRVIYVDTRVCHDETFTRADMPLKLNARGGGGTRFQPAFDWVADQQLTPACMIYITDMHLFGAFPVEPEYPVLWLSTTDKTAPWGETVRLER